MSSLLPVRVSMEMDSGVVCEGGIFRHVLVDGVTVQMWVCFDDKSFESRFLLDHSIQSFKVKHRVRDASELSLWEGAPWYV